MVQRKPARLQKSVDLSENLRLEDRLDLEHTQQPSLLEQFETEEDVEFKKVLKSLV